jgi:4-carboxymuconolactone decarboxylase
VSRTTPTPEAPRLAPVTAARLGREGRELLTGRLAAADRYLSGGPEAPPMPAILGLLGHHPALAANWLAWNAGLLEAPVLDPRDRELLVLRVGWRAQCRYEWAQHVRMALDAGLTPEQVAAVASEGDDDSDARTPVWSDRDRHLLAAADQMVVDHRVDDVTWRGLAAHFDEAQLLELLFVVGSYLCLALVLNSVGLVPDPGTDEGPGRLPGTEGS